MARAHVVIGAGPVGCTVASMLADAGHAVRVITRDGGGPDHPLVERVQADAADRTALMRAADGAIVIYNAASPPYSRWASDWPPLAASVLSVAEATGAVLVTASNLSAYGPTGHAMVEGDPLAATSTKGRVRAHPHQSGHLAASDHRCLERSRERGTDQGALDPADGPEARAWRRRVLRVGGIIQGCFAVFWLVRGSLAIGTNSEPPRRSSSVAVHSWCSPTGSAPPRALAPRTIGSDAKRLERSITIATVVELVAAFVLPAIVIAAGRSDLALPSIAITVGPLLLWLDHTLHTTQHRTVGWALTIGPVVLAFALSGFRLLAREVTPVVECSGVDEDGARPAS